MNWEATQAVAELVAALAVLGSLGYLAIQIRQNTASVQSGTVAQTSEILNRLRTEIWTDPESARIYDLALSGARIECASDATRMRLFWIALARDYEAIYYQYVGGQLPPSMWDGWAKEIVLIFSTPGGSDALEAMRDELLSAPFVQFLDDRLNRLDDAPIARIRDKWDLAGQKRRGEEEVGDGGHTA